MGSRPMRTCRLALAVPVEPDQDAPQDDEGGVEWRDVSCYATDDARLVVHRSADDTSVYCLSHAPSSRSIPAEATRSPDPLIGLANRLSRMTDWGGAGRNHGDRQGVPTGQKANLRGARPLQPSDPVGVGGRDVACAFDAGCGSHEAGSVERT